jgi:hypothetical protein
LAGVIQGIHPCPTQQGYGRLSDMGQEEIDRTWDEQGYFFQIAYTIQE